MRNYTNSKCIFLPITLAADSIVVNVIDRLLGSNSQYKDNLLVFIAFAISVLLNFFQSFLAQFAKQ